jgi:AcrR family transcriptional regulator
MSPRPRTIPDEQILVATTRAMSRLGPARLTLAEVAKEAGLSAATLVQRFGSKRGLMLALWASALEGIDGCFTTDRQPRSSPLGALLDAATTMARHTQTPEEMANHLAFLQIDVSDPEFHRYMLELSEKTEAGYRALLDEALEARELIPCDTAGLARAISAMTGGSLIGWAVFRQGTAESWVRRDLDTLIGPYRRKPSSRRRSVERGWKARRRLTR